MAAWSQAATRRAGRSKQTQKIANQWLPYWIFFNLAALGLALAATFSCFSRSTSDIHIMSASPLHLVNGLQAFINGGTTILNQTEGQNDSAFPDFELSALPDKYLFGATASQSWTALLNSSGISPEQQDSLWQRLSTASVALLVCSVVCPCIAALLVIACTPHYWTIIILSDLLSGAMAVAAASMWTSMFVSCTSQYSSGTDQTFGDYLNNLGFSPLTDDSGPDLRPAFVYGPGLPILWAAAGSHLTILIVAVGLAMISLMFLSTAMEAAGAEIRAREERERFGTL